MGGLSDNLEPTLFRMRHGGTKYEEEIKPINEVITPYIDAFARREKNWEADTKLETEVRDILSKRISVSGGDNIIIDEKHTSYILGNLISGLKVSYLKGLYDEGNMDVACDDAIQMALPHFRKDGF